MTQCYSDAHPAQNDDGEHDEPFNVTAIPQSLDADDAPTQTEVQHAMYGHAEGLLDDHIALFNARRPATISFNQLQHLRQETQPKRAIRTLSQRHRLAIDSEHLVDPSDANTAIATGPHYVDFVMYIGGRPGLDAILPNTNVDQSWSLHIDLSTIYRLWPKGKPSTLPFNAQGRLLSIGRVFQEHVWIAMVPNEWLEDDHDFNATGNWPILPSRTTAMETQHALMIIMFVAKMLSDRRVQDFHCDPEYPEVLSRESVNDATEIL